MAEFGILSLAPPLIAIGLSLILRQVIPSLVIGILAGATIFMGWNPVLGLTHMLDGYFLDALADRSHAAIVMFSMMLGGMVGVITCSGGSAGVVKKLSKIADSPRGGVLAAWLMGIIIFFDDYANTLIVGNTMRPFTDKLKISREKLAYVVDSTSAPIASIAVISTWIGFEMGLIGDAFSQLGIDRNVYLTFIETIPYRFYAVLALIMVPLVAVTGRDIGPMYTAERRARIEGKPLRDGAQPLFQDFAGEKFNHVSSSWNALAPIIVVILVTCAGLYWNGLQSNGPGPLYQIISAADSFSVLMWAAFLGLTTALFLSIFNSPLKFNESLEAMIEGVKSMLLAMVILILAWSLGKNCEDLGVAAYVSSVTQGIIMPWMMPVITFCIAAFISFATGTSWGTMAILVPIVIPVIYNLTGGDVTAHWHIMLSTIGSVLSGSIFGDHCSPISDTTIMSSMTSGSDHIDHVRTQLPYALLAALTAELFGDIPSGLGLNPFISLAIGIVVLYGILRLWGKKVDV
ncbi:Na+/H+ antiporter NhaC family protein [bacterium]|nr:Na+/H+ antiporter NhaC family protein [bacterium]